MELEKTFQTAEKWMRYGFALTGFILLGFFAINLHLHLKEPVYLPVYKEYYSGDFVNDSAFLKLKCLSNVYDSHQIYYVTFPEYDDLEAYKEEEFWSFGEESQDLQNSDTYLCYQYTEYDLAIHNAGENSSMERTITKAIIHYTNGDEQEISLGKIYLHADELEYHEVISNSTTSTSSDGTGYIEGEAADQFTILDIKSDPISDASEDFIQIQLSEQSLTPSSYQDGFPEIRGIQYNKGDKIRVDNKVIDPESVLEQFSTYELRPVMYVKNEAGEEYMTYLDSITYNARINNFSEIYKYLKAKGAYNNE